ncbi:LacI family transcriptional regulator [Virgibacillus soli]|nr:LacI family transcriptional regulator [Virgibacillus soli]MBP1916646.1 LacI family transcriptional regulator [Lederbergia galactosidilytica]
MVTISDVANATGLSTTTVSRVLNHYPYVAEETRNAVLKAVEQLGYIPNNAAQTLRRQKTNTIAVLVPRLTNPFFSHLIEKIEVEAAKMGMQILICHTRYSKQKEMEYLYLLNTKQVDGIIMTSIENKWKDIYKLIRNDPIVLCNEYVNEANVPIIRLNQVEGGYIGTKHLIEKGHTKIGYCSGGILSGVGFDRFQGYKQAMEEYELEIKQEWLFNDTFSDLDGRRVIHCIASLPDRPSAFFAGSDEVAVGMISEAKKINMKVPDDIAVIGFDDQFIAQIVEPALTTIHQPIQKIGEFTMQAMVQLLRSQTISNKREVFELPLSLIVRESS